MLDPSSRISQDDLRRRTSDNSSTVILPLNQDEDEAFQCNLETSSNENSQYQGSEEKEIELDTYRCKRKRLCKRRMHVQITCLSVLLGCNNYHTTNLMTAKSLIIRERITYHACRRHSEMIRKIERRWRSKERSRDD